MPQRLFLQIRIQQRGRTANTPESQPDDQEVGAVVEIEGDEVAGLNAEREEVCAPLGGAVVGLLPGVGVGAGPDAEGGGVEGDVGCEGVPRRKTVC